jgi:hypothetical protein
MSAMLIDPKTRAVAPFSPDARIFHNIYKLQKQILLRHQSYLIVFMGNKNYSSVAITNKSNIADKRIEDSHG